MSRFNNPIPQFILENGDLAAGGELTFYESGSNTILSIYADINESAPIANPVTLGSRGEVPNIFFSQSARVRLTDINGNQLFDVDPVGGASASGAFQIWNSNVVYNENDIVFGSNGSPYISIVIQNEGNDPILSAGNNPFWSQLLQVKFWNAAESFNPNDIVNQQGVLYKGITSDNEGNDPSTDDANNWISIADARFVVYDNTTSGISATNAQAALDVNAEDISNLQSETGSLNTVMPQTGGGALTALRTNEIRDGNTGYTLPLANSVLVNQTITITLPDEFKTNEPVVTRAGSDTISYSGGTDTSLTFDSGSSVSITLTSDGVSDWGL